MTPPPKHADERTSDAEEPCFPADSDSANAQIGQALYPRSLSNLHHCGAIPRLTGRGRLQRRRAFTAQPAVSVGTMRGSPRRRSVREGGVEPSAGRRERGFSACPY